MSPEQTEKSRKEFEAWMVAEGWVNARFSDAEEYAWDGWQAGREELEKENARLRERLEQMERFYA